MDEEIISINLLCNTEYKYAYVDKEEEINTSRIGTYHILELVKRDDKWLISKEWYNDPFTDSLKLDNIKVDSIKEYILSQGPRDFSNIGERRENAVQYAHRYCGAASEEKYGFEYNKNIETIIPEEEIVQTSLHKSFMKEANSKKTTLGIMIKTALPVLGLMLKV